MKEYDRKQWRLVKIELALLALTFFACLISTFLRAA